MSNIYDDQFLLQRPMLEALRAPEECVLLIDEIDRSDQGIRSVFAGVSLRFRHIDPRDRYRACYTSAGCCTDVQQDP